VFKNTFFDLGNFPKVETASLFRMELYTVQMQVRMYDLKNMIVRCVSFCYCNADAEAKTNGHFSVG